VRSMDGTQLAVWRSGSGPPLVAVHGTTADHTRWASVAARLGERFTLHAMDRRGRGRSGDVAPYSIQREAEDVAAVVRSAGERVVLLGHSYGGLCCLEAALQLSGLSHLLLYEPPLPVGPGIVSREIRSDIDQLVAKGDREAALLHFFREVVGASESEIGVLRNHPAWPSRVAAAHTIAREADAEEGYGLELSRFEQIDVPTLLIVGGASPAYFGEAAALLHAAIPDSRIHVMPGQRHIAMDTAPELFVDAVAAFALPDSNRDGTLA
jgi:pimeloyl-ACP methyl ester carboxylesterase